MYSKQQRLVEVAQAYYLEARTQAEIARTLGISRSQVSRYLSEAREQGIVQIRVVAPDEQASDLADRLRRRYRHLRAVIAAPVFDSDPEVVRATVGRYAANFLAETVRERQRVVLGCGRSLRATVRALPRREIPGVMVIQAMGNLGHEAHQIDYNEIARDAAAAFGGRPYYLSAPAILGGGSGSAAQFIEANPMLREALALARQADVFVVGLGSMESDMVYARYGLIREEELADLQGRAVGDICGRFFDMDGREEPSAFAERIVGISLEDIQPAELAIGVACGPDKAAPLLGAVRGRFINVLVSDEQTLRSVLALDDLYPLRELREGQAEARLERSQPME